MHSDFDSVEVEVSIQMTEISCFKIKILGDFPVVHVKNTPCYAGYLGSIPYSRGGKDPLEKEMATHFSIPAWRIPWTEEPGGLLSMGLQKSWTGLSDWAHTHTHTHTHRTQVGLGYRKKAKYARNFHCAQATLFCSIGTNFEITPDCQILGELE